MRISLLPTDMRTVWPFSTPVRERHRSQYSCLQVTMHLTRLRPSSNTLRHPRDLYIVLVQTDLNLSHPSSPTSRYRYSDRLPLLGLTWTSTHDAGRDDDRSLPAAASAGAAHHERTRVESLLWGATQSVMWLTIRKPPKLDNSTRGLKG